MKLKKIIPELIIGADNVYRTKNYIVKQVISLETPIVEDNGIMSYDTFYKRTEMRDKQHELVFSDRKRINGKRLPSTMFSIKYIDFFI